MGGSTKTYRDVQTFGLMDEYGGLRENLFNYDASKIGMGMNTVFEYRKKL